MIPAPAGSCVWLATGFTDMRKGFDGLAALVQDQLRRDPFCGRAFVFRGRQGRLIKVLWWDGQGLCLFAKRLEKGRFIWPATSAGAAAARCMSIDPAALPDDIDALKRIIGELARDAVAARAEIEKLRFQLARFKRAQFGRSSEKIEHTIEQLELAIETLDEDHAQRIAAIPAVAAAIGATSEQTAKPARRPLPEHLPREEIVHPGACSCPNCGGTLRRIGADVTETLDYVPGRFKVVRHVREAFSCRLCETVVQSPAPNHTIARGRAGPGLLAHIIVSKFDDHLPLYRQAEIYARDGVDLETSTLSGWVGATAAALAPLVEALRRDVLESDVLHGDDTPVPVLAPGAGKTKTGRL